MSYLKQALIGDSEISLRDFLAQDQIVVTKLDKNTARDWRLTLKAEDTDYPDYEKLEKFLVTRSFACEEGQHDPENVNKSNNFRKSNDKKSFSVSVDNKCSLCSQQHPLYRCAEFKKKTQDSNLNSLRRIKGV